MKKTVLPLILLAAACAPSAPSKESTAELASDPKADGSSWCHADLDSTGGTRMVFDYEVGFGNEEGGSQTFAQNVWLNVRNDAFQPGDQALAVVQVYQYPGTCPSTCQQFGNQMDEKQITLSYEDGRFTAPLPDLPILDVPPGTDGSDWTAYYWQLAVVENGTWYKDPATGSNLSYSPAAVAGSCAQGTSL